MKKYTNIRMAFSLMEMMVVLLIISIIAAATAPMVSKKMTRSSGSGDSPWVYSNARGDMAYNLQGQNMSAIIGAVNYVPGAGPASPRLVIAQGANDDTSAIAFLRNDNNFLARLRVTDNSVFLSNVAANQTQTVAIGTNQTVNNFGAVAVGNNVRTGICSTAVGSDSNANATGAIAIGRGAEATRDGAIAVSGHAENLNSVSIGANARAIGSYSVAIGSAIVDNDGFGTRARGNFSVAIGGETQTPAGAIRAINIGNKFLYSGIEEGRRRITLGDANDTVFIPGNLVVAGYIVGGRDIGAQNNFWCNGAAGYQLEDGDKRWASGSWGERGRVGDMSTIRDTFGLSDKRLKNVGKKYEAGLAELKKLNFYHYTFKSDKNNTPMVGVIAQDLQKVFPNAVTEDIYGYLRIRKDEMFYAVINAVKELDARITEIAEQVKANFDKIAKLEATVAEQQKTIDGLKAQNAEFEKRLAKLEKKQAKADKKQAKALPEE